MDTQVPQTETQQPTISLGKKFRSAREALNLSIEDVVNRTNLNVSIVEKLENDQFEGQTTIPAIFVSGYIRSYAQFLKMPEEEWKYINLGQKIENDLNKNARTGQVTNPYSSSSIGRWVGYLTVLVILVMGGMTALWWWENYQKNNNERDNLVQNYVATEEKAATTQTIPVSLDSPTEIATNTPATTVTPTESTQTPATPTSTAQQPATVQQTATTQPSTAQQPSSAEQTPATSNEPMTLNTTVTQTSDSVNTPLVVRTMPIENTAQAMLMQHSAEQTPATEQPSATDNPQTAAVGGDLQIEVTGSCWITVRDKNRKVLAQKEYKQGEILTFNEGAPYSLTIGAPANVKITYKGENYPLKIDGRVARFKLD